MTDPKDHPEQDPAEGSHEKRQKAKSVAKPGEGDKGDHRPSKH